MEFFSPGFNRYREPDNQRIVIPRDEIDDLWERELQARTGNKIAPDPINNNSDPVIVRNALVTPQANGLLPSIREQPSPQVLAPEPIKIKVITKLIY